LGQKLRNGNRLKRRDEQDDHRRANDNPADFLGETHG
jgi:hypothetical protein